MVSLSKTPVGIARPSAAKDSSAPRDSGRRTYCQSDRASSGGTVRARCRYSRNAGRMKTSGVSAPSASSPSMKMP